MIDFYFLAFDHCLAIRYAHGCTQLSLRTFSPLLLTNCVCPLDGVFLLPNNGSCGKLNNLYTIRSKLTLCKDGNCSN